MKISILRKNSYSKFNIQVILFILFYILFAFRRIKYSFTPEIDGIKLNNAIWLLPILFLVKVIFSKKNKVLLDKSFLFFILLIIVILLGGYKIDNISQYVYAVLIFIIPMLFIYSINFFDLNHFDYFIKSLIIFCLIYSVLAIISSSNYTYFMELLGNKTNYQTHYRASLMIGSSITVSYYFNITLPLCFYMNYTSKDKKWKILSLTAIIVNLLATTLLLSRLAFFISLIITLYYIFFVKTKHVSLKKISIIFLLIIGAILTINNFDLSRLFMGFNDQSTNERLIALYLGFHIFRKNFIFGSGMGRFFYRAYSNSYIEVDNIVGKIDPHNTLVLLLSEIGIAGTIIFVIILIKIINNFKYIRDVNLRKTSYMIIFSFILGSLGGSHIINEINFSTIFWIYMSFFRAIGKRDYYLKKINMVK